MGCAEGQPKGVARSSLQFCICAPFALRKDGLTRLRPVATGSAEAFIAGAAAG